MRVPVLLHSYYAIRIKTIGILSIKTKTGDSYLFIQKYSNEAINGLYYLFMRFEVKHCALYIHIYLCFFSEIWVKSE